MHAWLVSGLQIVLCFTQMLEVLPSTYSLYTFSINYTTSNHSLFNTYFIQLNGDILLKETFVIQLQMLRNITLFAM